ncbi:transposase-like protein [Mesorhizobium abyssinicae]
MIPEAAWQRCALDHLPRKHGDDCLQELRWLHDRRDLAEAKADVKNVATNPSTIFYERFATADREQWYLCREVRGEARIDS